ncbi:MAG: VOC family protein [Phenylobacterium sp.]|uniref:VOC family protein n=1 Tax=Phenylobacterium sp. TaxID=1871053 RepID=UPI001A3C8061|nr:VOC family protein [Phenylobacterium sp.]MBL8774227.1 VOC family protein [Phenylobacterium sp.]
MIGYTTLGVTDLERARAFYDAVLVPLGGRRAFDYERSTYFGGPRRGAMLGVTLPHDGGLQSVGNGVMVALEAPSDAAVDQVHAAALAAGGSCEGPPGPRGDFFYAAYFRDPDGNKLCVYKFPER